MKFYDFLTVLGGALTDLLDQKDDPPLDVQARHAWRDKLSDSLSKDFGKQDLLMMVKVLESLQDEYLIREGALVAEVLPLHPLAGDEFWSDLEEYLDRAESNQARFRDEQCVLFVFLAAIAFGFRSGRRDSAESLIQRMKRLLDPTADHEASRLDYSGRHWTVLLSEQPPSEDEYEPIARTRSDYLTVARFDPLTTQGRFRRWWSLLPIKSRARFAGAMVEARAAIVDEQPLRRLGDTARAFEALTSRRSVVICPHGGEGLPSHFAIVESDDSDAAIRAATWALLQGLASLDPEAESTHALRRPVIEAARNYARVTQHPSTIESRSKLIFSDLSGIDLQAQVCERVMGIEPSRNSTLKPGGLWAWLSRRREAKPASADKVAPSKSAPIEEAAPTPASARENRSNKRPVPFFAKAAAGLLAAGLAIFGLSKLGGSDRELVARVGFETSPQSSALSPSALAFEFALTPSKKEAPGSSWTPLRDREFQRWDDKEGYVWLRAVPAHPIVRQVIRAPGLSKFKDGRVDESQGVVSVTPASAEVEASAVRTVRATVFEGRQARRSASLEGSMRLLQRAVGTGRPLPKEILLSPAQLYSLYRQGLMRERSGGKKFDQVIDRVRQYVSAVGGTKIDHAYGEQYEWVKLMAEWDVFAGMRSPDGGEVPENDQEDAFAGRTLQQLRSDPSFGVWLMALVCLRRDVALGMPSTGKLSGVTRNSPQLAGLLRAAKDDPLLSVILLEIQSMVRQTTQELELVALVQFVSEEDSLVKDQWSGSLRMERPKLAFNFELLPRVGAIHLRAE